MLNKSSNLIIPREFAQDGLGSAARLTPLMSFSCNSSARGVRLKVGKEEELDPGVQDEKKILEELRVAFDKVDEGGLLPTR